MGARGPLPARSDQRRRTNKPETPTETVEVEGDVAIPEPDESWHATAADWFRSLTESGQSRYFEPSDWQTARFCASLMSQCFGKEPSAQMVAQVRGMMADLLTTEGARRRVGIELERKAEQPTGTGPNVSRLEDRRQRVTDAS